ncbi:organoarsenical effux MFS transporter ArsJ [Synechococcus elongatus IITB4]|uniref:organoarsenical effux MFS transporter ArsJ n=1 Tax=Synechococcus elongatus TaxID=32046 RepID=UPI0030CD8FF1
MSASSEAIALRRYALVTLAYWGFTITDGALRLLVLLYFNQIGYSPLAIASLFLLYEIFGIVTNFLGGWIGARFGLKLTLYGGIALQIGALLLLSGLNRDWPMWGAIAWVMAAQALSGIAKDLTKMSAKSAIRLVVPRQAEGRLFKWVAVLTGSKNALKGVGFFVGSLLLASLGYQGALQALAVGLSLVLISSIGVPANLGQLKRKPKFKQLFSKSQGINILSAARFFLFGARDIWFVVALPVFLRTAPPLGLGWSFTQTGAFLALWVIGYGLIQTIAPPLLRWLEAGRPPSPQTVQRWGSGLAIAPAGMAIALQAGWAAGPVVIAGLALFGLLFAVNSAVHSYLVLAYSADDQVALDVGFYYMANSAGRLAGTVLSGLIFQLLGLTGCLWGSALMVALAAAIALALPALPTTPSATATS